VVYPTELGLNSHELQAATRKGIERTLKLKAKEYLPDRVKELADESGFFWDVDE
jgi:hypothetical protein